MDYLEGKEQSSVASASSPALSDDCNLQCNDHQIESNNTNPYSSSTQGNEIPNDIGDEAIIQEDEEAEENADEEADATEEANMIRKRKRYTSLRTTMKKANGQIIFKPLPSLKLKAMLLEDYGHPALVNQVLEELDGEVSPGGATRFRRRRNAEGAMEYWLEEADLVNIRKEAGVNDPCWVPPDWMPRDCPTQQISILKREVELIAQSLEEFRKEVRALMEETFSMFSTMRSEIKKMLLVEKDYEKKGVQGVVTMEEKERSRDAQYEAQDNNYSTGYKTTSIMVHDPISGDDDRDKKVKDDSRELPSKCCCTSHTSLSEGAGS